MKAKQVAIFIFGLSLSLLLFIWAFSKLPIQETNLAIDWKQIWRATHNFTANYGSTELRTPPWVLPIIWPFTVFALAPSWALAALATLSLLLLSVPRNKKRSTWILSLLFLAAAYPTIRQLVDGNLEALVISGVLIAAWSLKNKKPVFFAFALLLSASKIQEIWLLLPLFLFIQFRSWSKKDIAISFLLIAAWSLPFLLWRGEEWINAILNFPWRGTAIDSSLLASASRFGIPFFFYWIVALILLVLIWRVLKQDFDSINRLQISVLVTAGLLIGPYAASNSLLTPLALGVIPLSQQKPKLGIPLLGLFYFPYFFVFRPELRFAWESSYWTGVLIVTLLAFLYALNSSKPALSASR